MAEFKDSTQLTNWLLDDLTIASRRQAAYAAAASARDNTASLLSPIDEAALRKFHERRILRFVQAIQFPDKVAATAIVYFKRFFVDQSVMDFNPAAIALSSLYAACKVEEVPLSADDLIARFDVVMNGVEANTDVAEVPLSRDGTCQRFTAPILLNIELAFLQILNFHLICYHPFRSLGILRELLKTASMFSDGDGDAEMKDGSGSPVHADKRLGELMARAQYIIFRRAFLSDLSLSRTPAVLAIAAIAVAAAEADNGPSVMNIIDAVTKASVSKVSSKDKLVTTVTDTFEEMKKLTDRAPENDAVTIASLEKKRRRVQTRDNFLTNAVREEEEAMDLRQVDQDEAKRSRVAREKTAKLLGLDAANGNVRDPETMAETPRKRQRQSS